MIRIYTLVLLTFLSGNWLAAVARTSPSPDDNSVVAGSDQYAQCEQPKESYLDVDHTRLRYVDAGSGPVVVMIHGNAGSVDDWDFKSMGRLCHDHRLIAIDRPGHGKSDRP